MPSVQATLKELMKRNPVYPEFVEWLRVQSGGQLRDVTIYGYLRCVDALVSSYGLNLEEPNPEEVVTDLVNGARISSATMALRTFVMRRYLEFKGLSLSAEVTKLLKSKRKIVQKKLHPKDLISMDEVSDIVSHTRRPSLRAFFMCLYDTAARPGALCRLNIEDVQQDKYGFVFIFSEVKNPQSRRLVRLLIPKVIQFFEQWWSVHPDKDSPEAPVFLNQYGERYNSQQLLMTLKLQHQERLGKNLNLYLFRKSRATQLLKEKKFTDIEVKMRLGHKKHSQMLEQYYAIIDEYDQADTELEYMGAKKKKQGDVVTILCSNCGAPNDEGSKSCVRCMHPLTEEEVLRQSQELEKEIKAKVEERVAQQQRTIEMRMEALETLMRDFSHLLGTEDHKVIVGDTLPPFEPVREDD